METSQEPPPDLAIYLGLQGFEVESIEIVEAPTPTKSGRRIKAIHLRRRSGLHVCPDCGRGHREGLFEEFERIRFARSKPSIVRGATCSSTICISENRLWLLRSSRWNAVRST